MTFVLGTPGGQPLGLPGGGSLLVPGVVLPPISAVLNATEANDTLAATGRLDVIWTGSGRGGGDTFQHPRDDFVFVHPAGLNNPFVSS